MAELTGKDEIREAVRERYAAAASSVGEGGSPVAAPLRCRAPGGGCGCGTDVPDACGGEEFGPACTGTPTMTSSLTRPSSPRSAAATRPP